MSEDLEAILRRVASGELTPEEAEPLVTRATRASVPPAGYTRPALPTAPAPPAPPTPPVTPAPPPPPGAPPAPTVPSTPASGQRSQRTVRLQVVEGGKTVVNLRMPVSWAALAGNALPGISGTQAEQIRDAIRAGDIGTILNVQDEDGDGVIISTE